jgi:hypothetical protein
MLEFKLQLKISLPWIAAWYMYVGVLSPPATKEIGTIDREIESLQGIHRVVVFLKRIKKNSGLLNVQFFIYYIRYGSVGFSTCLPLCWPFLRSNQVFCEAVGNCLNLAQLFLITRTIFGFFVINRNHKENI